jgi:hypothetical protein
MKLYKVIQNAVHVYSSINFYIDKGGLTYNIAGRAMFYKHPSETFITANTLYEVLSITCNGHYEDLKDLSELVGMSESKLKKLLHKEFMNYADELPF